MPESVTEGSSRALEFLAYKLPPRPGRGMREERSRSMLLRALDQGTTIAFVGSGVPRPFGYPSWDELASDVLRGTEEVLKVTAQPTPGSLDYVQSLVDGTRAMTGRLPETALMFLIGACKKVLEQNELDRVYHSLIRKKFARARKNPLIDPFEAILQLPIRRFVTTNYDCQIERALVKWRSGEVADRDFGPRPLRRGEERGRLLTFTQRPESLGQLALFALAGARGNDNMVFHCHGRYDDPESIIATEADYQQWYLGREDGASRAFQQSIEFLLGSNPLLF